MERGTTGARTAHRNLVLTAAIAGLGGLLFGYDTGIIAGAMLFIGPDFGLDDFARGLVVGAVPIGAAVGALLGGRVADRHGRRLVIVLSAIVFVIGSGISAAAPDATVLVIARLALGVAIGFASAVAPVYISELAPPDQRGRLVTFFQLSVTIGIFVAYLVGLLFAPIDGWRWMLGLGALPAILLGVGMARMPQSPRWLVMVGREYSARETLAKIREGNADAIDFEMHEIEDGLKEEPGGWHELLTPLARAALLVGLSLAVLQQITGINTVIYYAPTIVQYTGISSDSAAILTSVAAGIVNVGMTLVAIRLLDRLGRRALLIGGVSGMAIALFLIGLAFTGDPTTTLNSVLAVFGLMTFIASFAISLGPIFWLLNAELYPLRIRGKAASLGATTNWVAAFVVSLTFLSLLSALGKTETFWLYGALSVFTVFFCWRFVPETKDRTLEQIQEFFAERVKSR